MKDLYVHLLMRRHVSVYLTDNPTVKLCQLQCARMCPQTPAFSPNSMTLRQFGWDLEDKRKELFHSEARFLLVHPPQQSTPSGAITSLEDLKAFAMFRYDKEKNRRGQAEPVAYL